MTSTISGLPKVTGIVRLLGCVRLKESVEDTVDRVTGKQIYGADIVQRANVCTRP